MAKSFRDINAEILAQLDIVSEYRSMGVRFPGNATPRSSGMVSCFGVGRDDNHPSAWCNVTTGYYGDSGADAGAYTLSLWDFAAAHGGYGTWQDARKMFAAKVGVTIGSDGEKRTERWRDRLEFQQWTTPGNDTLAMLWCRKHKRGVSLESIKASGGVLAYFPCYRDKKTGEQRRLKGHVQVVAIPAYGDFLLAADPVAWVIWDLSGSLLEVPQPKGYVGPKQHAKMLSIGETRGSMMGLSGLIALSDDERRAKIERVWKSGGPSDMLAIDSAIRAEVASGKRIEGSHIVVTNASGEMGDVLHSQAKLFAGLKTCVVGDSDAAGVNGAAKWVSVLRRSAACERVTRVELPYAVSERHGRDARDFLTGVKE